MLLAVIISIIALIVYWIWQLQPNSPYVCRSYKVIKTLPENIKIDYIIIGAGPGGIAAAHYLIEQNSENSVLLIERGLDPSYNSCNSNSLFKLLNSLKSLCQMHNLLSFSVDLIGSTMDSGMYIHRPFHNGEITNNNNNNINNSDESLLFTPYPRGRGVGGSSNLDWALYMPSLYTKEKKSNNNNNNNVNINIPYNFTVSRNPLSWGFAESAAVILKKKHLSTLDNPHANNSVFPGLLRLDKDGRRLPISNYLFQPKNNSSKFLVAEGCEVINISINDNKTITSVTCKSLHNNNNNNNKVFTIIVQKGVILSAGVVGTPKILHQVLPHFIQKPFIIHDAITLPLIFQAMPGISDDKINIRSFKSYLSFYLTRRGPFLNPICDTLAAIDIPILGPKAEIIIFLIPFGGRDRSLYNCLGLDRTLGAFREGFIMLMTLRGVDGIYFELKNNKDISKSQEKEKEKEDKKLKKVISSPFSTLSSEVSNNVISAFIQGIELCRKIVLEKPLSYLSTGQEAVDVTLIQNNKSNNNSINSTRAIQYVQLMHTPVSKLTEKQKSGAKELLNWVKESSQCVTYMKSYIKQHSFWLGFGSGSCANILTNENSLRVSDCKNLFIGDCSGVSEEIWKSSGFDALKAGSVSTAMSIGKTAAMELTSI